MHYSTEMTLQFNRSIYRKVLIFEKFEVLEGENICNWHTEKI